MHDDDDIKIVLAALVAGLAIGGGAAGSAVHNFHRTQAIQHNAATWDVHADGSTTFRWLTNAPCVTNITITNMVLEREAPQYYWPMPQPWPVFPTNTLPYLWPTNMTLTNGGPIVGTNVFIITSTNLIQPVAKP